MKTSRLQSVVVFLGLCVVACIILLGGSSVAAAVEDIDPSITRSIRGKILYVNTLGAVSSIRQAAMQMKELKKRGYDIRFALGPLMCSLVAEFGWCEDTCHELIVNEEDASSEFAKFVANVNELTQYNTVEIGESMNLWNIAKYSVKLAEVHGFLHGSGYENQLKLLRELFVNSEWKPDLIVGYPFGALAQDFAEFELGVPFILQATFAPSMLYENIRDFSQPSSVLAASQVSHETHFNVRFNKVFKAICDAIVNQRAVSALNRLRIANGFPQRNSFFDYEKVLKLHSSFPFLLEPASTDSPLVVHTGSPYEPYSEENDPSLGKLCESKKKTAFNEGDTEKLMLLLDDAEKRNAGVVYMAFGSIAMISPDALESLLTSVMLFLKERDGSLVVALRVQGVSIEKLVADIEIRHGLEKGRVIALGWAPQARILGHHAVRVFITHGGSSSVAETLLNKVVPVVIPFFGDQPSNGRKLVEAGVGFMLSKFELDEESVTPVLQAAYDDVNGTYRHAIERVLKRGTTVRSGSERFADEVEDVYFNGVEYRIPLAFKTPWIISSGIDIIATFAFIILFPLLSALLLMLSILRNKSVTKSKTE